MDQEISSEPSVGSSKQVRNSLVAVAASLVIATAFNYLFIDKTIGVSLLVFTGLTLVVIAWFVARFKYSYKSSAWLAIPILFFATMPIFRDNDFLTFLNVLAIFGLLLILARSLSKENILNFGIVDYIASVVVWPFKYLRNAFITLGFIGKNIKGTSTGGWKPVVVGFLVAIPVLLFFGALFSSADLAFRAFLDNFLSFNIPDTLIPRAIVLVITFIASLGSLTYVFDIPSKYTSMYVTFNKKDEGVGDKSLPDRKVEVMVFLSLIAALFLLFIVFQINYLFGGAVNIESNGFTYAEYARQGFWELLVVAFTTLLILLGVDAVMKKSGKRLASFILPSLFITLEVMIIIVSAFKRLMLYQSTYGMTELRLYVAGFIILLAVVFVILAAKLIWKKEHKFFAFGTLLSLILFIVSFNLLNPDKYIAQKNIDRFHATGKIDVVYLGTLSADAVPEIISVYDELNDEDKLLVVNSMISKKELLSIGDSDWTSYNISRKKAIVELYKKF